MKPKLSSTVSVVKINDSIVEFFKTNTRQQVRVRVSNDDLLELVLSLDGTRDIGVIAKQHSVDLEELNSLILFLKTRGILDNVAPCSDFDRYESFRRVINFLNDYSHSHQHLLGMWDNIRNSSVLIVGLGAVGSWVACNLVQSGVRKLVLMDPDVVDKTNLHRQFGYIEDDEGRNKTDALESRLLSYNDDLCIVKSNLLLNDQSLHAFDSIPLDLVINCADKPTVDMTSFWVGEYCMSRGIPHIIGGGYNMHLSLIGQTVIPGKSACVKCYERHLNEENKIDPTRVKKLLVKNRKIGSLGPMCSMIASMVGMEAIKILTKTIPPANINRRGEFDILTMDISYRTYERRNDCEWCGKSGKYYRT